MDPMGNALWFYDVSWGQSRFCLCFNSKGGLRWSEWIVMCHGPPWEIPLANYRIFWSFGRVLLIRFMPWLNQGWTELTLAEYLLEQSSMNQREYSNCVITLVQKRKTFIVFLHAGWWWIYFQPLHFKRRCYSVATPLVSFKKSTDPSISTKHPAPLLLRVLGPDHA